MVTDVQQKAIQPKNLLKPIFIVSPFDPQVEEHRKGFATIRVNSSMSQILCDFIRQTELDPGEECLHALMKSLDGWRHTRLAERFKSRVATGEIPDPNKK